MGEHTKKILMNADCLEAMKKMPDACIDAIVTDPPYGLSFMGRTGTLAFLEWSSGRRL